MNLSIKKVLLSTIASILILFIFLTINFLSYQKPFHKKLPSIIGYTIDHSVTEGDNLPLYIHSDGPYDINLFHLEKKKRLKTSIKSQSKIIQESLYHPIKGFNWDISFQLTTESLKSGYYIIEITNNNTNETYQIPIIVKPKSSDKIVIIASTNTWDAYNSYGGKSFYTDSQTPITIKLLRKVFNKAFGRDIYNSKVLPNKRPLNAAIDTDDPKTPFHSHTLRGEWALSSFLHHHKIEHSVYSDKDFAYNFDIHKAKMIFFNTHSEYWSIEMMGKLVQYLESGGKVFFASGNNIYREIKYNKDFIEVVNSQIDIKTTTSLIGSYYTDSGYGSYAPFKVTRSSHWLFNNTNVSEGTTFGTIKGKGASGWETDKINLYTKGYKTIAVGTNSIGPAYMIYKDTPYNGWLFNASSLTFVTGLYHDPVINAIVLNAVKNALGE